MTLARFADFAAGLHDAALPDDVLHAARRCIVDWFACALRGAGQPPASLLTAAFNEDASPMTAALINGAAAHTVEFDDIYRDALYHPGAPVIAAAYALAQARGLSGAAFLNGIVAGYEVSNRLGEAAVPAHYEYWHPTGTMGTFGAAAAAACLLGLDGERTHHALANAGTLAAGLQQAFRADAMAKPLHAGQAASTGVMVALAAERGVTGAPEILDGPRGFGAAMCEQPDWAAAADKLGVPYTILSTTFKNHACCGHIHAAIDGVLALSKEHGLTPEYTAAITIGTYAKAIEITGNAEPRTIFEAKFSLPYCVSVALMTGSARLDAFTDELLADQGLRALMAKVELTVAPEIEAGFPTIRAADITVETADGRVLHHFAPTRKGDPENPLTDDELSEKFLELTATVLGESEAATLLDTLWHVDGLDNAADLSVRPPQGAPLVVLGA